MVTKTVCEMETWERSSLCLHENEQETWKEKIGKVSAATARCGFLETGTYVAFGCTKGRGRGGMKSGG